MKDEDEFGPVNLNDEEMDEFEFYPIYNACLPSWWKHTKEGKEVLEQLTQCQERLAEALELFQRVWVMLEECDSLTPPKYNFEADELHELIQDFIEKTT